MLLLISHGVIVGFALFIFLRHNAHCFMLFINSMLCVVLKDIALGKHRWSKCQLNNSKKVFVRQKFWAGYATVL